jgi:hypothetical protein
MSSIASKGCGEAGGLAHLAIWALVQIGMSGRLE